MENISNQDSEAARKIFEYFQFGIVKSDVEVYFWKPSLSEVSTAKSLIRNAEGTTYEAVGLSDGKGFYDSSFGQFQTIFFNVLSEFKALGAISSYHEVTSPYTTTGGLVDMAVGITDLPVVVEQNGDKYITNGITLMGVEQGINADSDWETPIFLDADFSTWTSEYQKYVIRHEIGHAIGLRHPSAVGLEGTKYDSYRYTMMSENGLPDLAGIDPDGLMMLDYLALKEKGYLSLSYKNQSNTPWSWAKPVIATIYDAGGDHDYISAVGLNIGSIIDLRDGNFSSYGAGINGDTALENLAIFWDSIIEDASGSSKDDVLIGNDVNNEIRGYDGNDFIYGSGEDYDTTDWSFSQAHKDAYAATVDDSTKSKTDNDTLYGGDDDDHIYGLSGKDTLYGDAGEDELYGGTEEDELQGGSGNDTLYGDDGHDFIFGGFGDDSIEGGKGSDHIYGGDGKFSVVEGNDTIDGGEGNDILEGGIGNDKYIFTGTFGRDIIKDSDNTGSIEISGSALSSLTQSTKDSIIYYDDVKNPTKKAILIDEGDGKQSLTISTVTKSGYSIIDSGNSITIKDWSNGSLGLTLKQASTQTSTTPNVVTITGNGSDNALSIDNKVEDDASFVRTGNESLNISGGSGRDLILGLRAGNDTLNGGDDADIIMGGNEGSSEYGKDEINGDGGNDYIISSPLSSTVHGNTGNDFIRADQAVLIKTSGVKASSGSSGYASHPELTRDQVWQDLLSVFNYDFYYFGFKSLKENINEYASVSGAKFVVEPLDFFQIGPDNWITGSDLIYTSRISTFSYDYDKGWVGKAKPSYVTFNSPLSYDMRGLGLFGSHTYADEGATLFGDEGTDAIQGGIYSDYISGGVDKDTLWGGFGNDVIDGGSDDAADSIRGNEGDDTLIGGAGDDTLWGGDATPLVIASDNDILYGGSGKDYLYGEQGNDYLDGGIGEDTLSGGSENDYLFSGDDEVRDQLYGGTGNDTLVGSAKLDYFNGGGGNDIFIMDTHQVRTTAPVPTANFNSSSNDGLAFTLASVTSSTSSSGPTVATVDDLDGSNTIGLVGAGNVSENISVRSFDDHLAIFVNNIQQFNIRSGVTFNQTIVTGSTVEEIASANITPLVITDDTFLNGSDTSNAQQINTTLLMLNGLQDAVTVTGASANAYLAGGILNDTLTAHADGTRFIGGHGDDVFNGSSGNDTYLIRLGDDRDVINEKGGINSIKFDKNISVEQVAVGRSRTDLILVIAGDQTVTIKNVFDPVSGKLNSENTIKEVIFYDGTIRGLAELLQEASLASNANDWITYGDEGANLIVHNYDTEEMVGGAGDDVYTYARQGDFTNFYVEDTQGNDTLQLGQGIVSSEVNVYRGDDDSLVIRMGDHSEAYIKNAFDSSGNITGNFVENIKFSDNTVWNSTRIQQEIQKDYKYSAIGTEGQDWLSNRRGETVFIGGKGDDFYYGSGRDDVYQYALGDGIDVIERDIGGHDVIEFTSGISPNGVSLTAVGSDVVLTMTDGGSITVKNMLADELENQVNLTISSIISNLSNNLLSVEKLIEDQYGLEASGDLMLKFENQSSTQSARVNYTVFPGDARASNLSLTINLNNFSAGPNGTGPFYYDRIIAHELVHAVMAVNMNTGELPAWFSEGVAEFIHGADERVKSDLASISSQESFNSLFLTSTASPGSSAGYSVSYIAVKLLHHELLSNGGVGIKELFDYLKAGKTLDQSLALLSTTYEGLSSLWTDLASFENHARSVGFASMDTLLNLNNADTGSIAGSDYGNKALDAGDVVPDIKNSGSSKFNVIIPAAYENSEAKDNGIESIKFADGTIWSAEQILLQATKLMGSDNADYLTGNDVANLISGLGGDDNIISKGGDDILVGGEGNDTLHGGYGNDTYQFNVGHGSDIIFDTAGINKLVFGSGISPSAITLLRHLDNIKIIINQTEIITLINVFEVNTTAIQNMPVQIFEFSSGVIWTADDIKAALTIAQPTSGNDELYGLAKDEEIWAGLGNDTIKAGAGNDTLNGGGDADRLYGDAGNDILSGGDGADQLYGDAGNDTLTGGKGNDILSGSLGDDVFRFELGDGNDQIMYSSYPIQDNGLDTLLLGSGISTSNVTLSLRDGLIITLSSGETISIPGMFNEKGELNANMAIGAIQFNDGTIWNREKIRELVLATPGIFVSGTSSSDKLTGTSGNDTIAGLSGNDTLQGDLGDDIYEFTTGDGIDTIYDAGGTDVIKFSAGVLPGNVTLRNTGVYYVLTLDSNNVIRVALPSYGGVSNSIIDTGIEKIIFSDGSVWTQAEMINQVSTFTSTSGNDNFSGNYFNDVISGGLGDDRIKALDGNDSINGDEGNDYLSGEIGNDTIWGGLGADSIEGGNDNDLLYGGDDNDILVGGSGSDLIDGGAGNDIIRKDDFYFYEASYPIENYDRYDKGNDTLIGGTGNDSFISYRVRGNDTYKYALGDGIDTIVDQCGVDRIVFDASVNPNSCQLTQSENDLWIQVSGSDRIIYKNYFKTLTSDERIQGIDYKIESIEFNNGVVWGSTEIAERLTSPVSTDTTAPNQPTAAFDTTGKIVSGSAEAGSTVSVKNASSVEIGSGTANSSGNYSITLSTALINKEVVSVTAKDTAGNVSQPASATAPLLSSDTTPPSQPSASFNSNGNVVSGSAEAGSTVSIKNSSAVQIGSGTATSSGTYSITLATALINKETINVTAKDAAGNVSQPTTATAPDKTPPAQPTASFNTTGTIISGNAEASSRVYFNDASGNALGDAKASSSGAYQFTLTTALVNKEVVSASAKDASGNYSTLAYATAPDKTLPSQPTAAFDSAGKVVSGSAEAGSIVSVKNASSVEIGSDTANSSGNYSITLSTALINKEVVTVTAKDSAGNVSQPTSATAPLLSSDTSPPSQPSAAFNSAGTIVSGSAEAGSTVSIKNSSAVQIGSGTATSSGTYSITLGTALINKETVNVTAKDAAGNVSQSITATAPDKTPPAAPTAKFDTTGKVITGYAEASSRVYFKDAAGNALGDVKAGSSTGAYQFTLSTALVNKEMISATAKDASGNYSTLTYFQAPLVTQSVTASKSSKISESATTAAQVDAMIQAMASFAPPVSAETRPLVGYADLNPPLLVVSH